ncbi:MAG: ThuA domain-containing protein [Gemmatimonadetes bacterium]|nr:ThuA domain-containing protein [Gemmatimonadota bacterium]
MRLQRLLVPAVALLLTCGSAAAVAAQSQDIARFNGRDLDGWREVGVGRVAVGTDGSFTTGGGPGLIYYPRTLRDFVLELEYRGETPDAESGIFLRLPAVVPADPVAASRISYEVQIRDQALLPAPANQQAPATPRPNWELTSGGLVGVAAAWRPVARAGEWNSYRIEVTGQRYQVTLNGVKVADYIGDRAHEGFIALEHGATSRVHFRNVRLTPLEAANAPQKLADLPALQRFQAAGTPIRVLAVSASHGFRHSESIDASKMVLKGLEWANEFRFTFTDDAAQINARTLANYDVLLLNNATLRAAPANPSDTTAVRISRTAGVAAPLTMEQQQAMTAFVRSGKGLMTIHSGIDANYGWQEFREMVGGGLFRAHPWTRPAQINVEDPTNAAVSHFGQNFNLREEIYVLDVNPRPNARVLLSLDMPSVGEAAGSQDHPIAFVKRHGEGRVFSTVLGHFGDNWRRPDFVQHIMQGLRIAAGTVPADFTPQAPRQSAR